MNGSLNPAGDASVKRLSDQTRELAFEYLRGGMRSRLHAAPVDAGELNNPPGLPEMMRRAKCAVMLAERADLCILPGERLAGAAPCIEAVYHSVPGMGISSISHTTVDFGNAIRLGLSGLERELAVRSKQARTAEETMFAEALCEVISAIRIWIKRYISAYNAMLDSGKYPDAEKNIRRIVHNLERCPENPPETFSQAVQSFWIFFEFERLCGNWSGLGRFDKILGGYLENDLKNKTITLDEARELVAHFWIKGTEWCHGLVEDSPFAPGSGDAQSYQNIVLGGIDAAGNPVENEVTYLVLDVVEELHISDYPVAVRLNRNTSERLLEKIASVQLLGGGIVSVYNEEVVIEGLLKFGYPPEEAREFTNDGCWEVIIPGKTAFSYYPFDTLKCFQTALFSDPVPENPEALYQEYLKQLRIAIDGARKSAIERYYSESGTDIVLSLLMPSCRENLRSYQANGTKYLVKAIHAGGLPDVANSMIAIKKLVSEEKKLTLPELAEILRKDWKDNESLRRHISNAVPYYGNDSASDAEMKRVFDDYTEIVGEQKKILDVLTPAGISTFGREINFAEYRMATAFGKHAHEYLAPNLSPTPGTDKSPVTAILNSYCKMDFTRTPNCCPLDLRLSAGIRAIPGAEKALAQILKVFVLKKGVYVQIDVVSPEMLRLAQKEPDRFPNLVVRISGWSARFATLNREWQDMIINRTVQEMA